MRIASLVDPALDIERISDLNELIRTRDPALTLERPGMRLAWFTLRDIPASAWSSYVMVGASDSEQRRRAFIMAVASVENLTDRQGKVRAGMLTGTFKYGGPHGTRTVWSDAEVDELFAPAIVEDIGEVARVRAIVPFGAELRFLAPPSSLAALMARVRVRAEELASSQALKGHPPGQPAPRPKPDGDGATAAPATGSQTASPAGPPTE